MIILILFSHRDKQRLLNTSKPAKLLFERLFSQNLLSLNQCAVYQVAVRITPNELQKDDNRRGSRKHRFNIDDKHDSNDVHSSRLVTIVTR